MRARGPLRAEGIFRNLWSGRTGLHRCWRRAMRTAASTKDRNTEPCPLVLLSPEHGVTLPLTATAALVMWRSVCLLVAAGRRLVDRVETWAVRS